MKTNEKACVDEAFADDRLSFWLDAVRHFLERLEVFVVQFVGLLKSPVYSVFEAVRISV
jgi:hypothetical protein